jgi:hypothetical protein
MTHRGNPYLYCCESVSWALKDGQVSLLESTEDSRLSFVLTEFDSEYDTYSVVAWTQLVLPGFGLPTEDDPSTIWLGAPPGVEVCREPPRSAGPDLAARQEEVQQPA